MGHAGHQPEGDVPGECGGSPGSTSDGSRAVKRISEFKGNATLESVFNRDS